MVISYNELYEKNVKAMSDEELSNMMERLRVERLTLEHGVHTTIEISESNRKAA